MKIRVSRKLQNFVS